MNFLDALKANDQNEIARKISLNPDYAYLQAAYTGDFNKLSKLTKEELVKIRDKSSATVMHYAAVGGQIDIIDYLIDNEISVNIQDKEGRTPLHWVAFTGYDAMITYLICRKGDIKALDNDGRTTIHYASELSNINTIKLLMSKGVDINKLDCHGRTALYYTKSGHIRNYLQQNGLTDATVQTTSEKTKWCDKIKDSPFKPINTRISKMSFLVALQDGDKTEINKYLESDPGYSFLKAAFDGNLDAIKKLDIDILVQIKDDSGAGIIHYAAASGNNFVLGWLFAKKVAINQTDNYGMTAIHYAVTGGKVDTVSYLIALGVDMNQKDQATRTAVHLAACYGRKDIIDYLIKTKRININEKTDLGKTALDYAIEYEFDDLVKFLKENGASEGSKTTLERVDDDSKECVVIDYSKISSPQKRFKTAQITIKRSNLPPAEITVTDQNPGALPFFVNRENDRKRLATSELDANAQKFACSRGREL